MQRFQYPVSYTHLDVYKRQALQACELYENALTGAQGRYYEDPVYEVNGALAAQFDKSFPPKKVITGTPSQKRFEEVSSMRRKAR